MDKSITVILVVLAVAALAVVGATMIKRSQNDGAKMRYYGPKYIGPKACGCGK